VLGAPNNVMLHRGEHFPHNYNAVARAGFYNWLNQHFALGQKSPVIERDFAPLSRGQLTVWDDQHPAPKANDQDLERKVLRWLKDDSQQQLTASAASLGDLRKTVGAAAEVLVGRTYASAGTCEWDLKHKQARDTHVEMTGVLRNKTHGEELPVCWLYPKTWNNRVVLWLTGTGKAGLFQPNGQLLPAVQSLVAAGTTVVGADLLFQGEFLPDGQEPAQTRVVNNPRQVAAYTQGYNPTLFAQRVHDVLSLLRYVKTAEVAGHPRPERVSIAGWGSAGPIAAVARSVAVGEVDRLAIDTRGFRFSQLLDYRDPQFLPGGAKYLDLPGLLAVNGSERLWLAGETRVPELVARRHAESSDAQTLVHYTGAAANQADQAAAWLAQ